jgi:2-C-methyl-D-erythritol 2,4-cyclodiphosphate synthase
LRIGLGYDSHRLGTGGPLRVGGMDVDADVHAIGHSDADVLLHALTDALLGAIAGGDIGQLFPDTAAENAGRCSRDFVTAAIQRVAAAGYHVVNVDSVILVERPKLAPHLERMRTVVAEMLGIAVEQVSIKAKTGEGVGEIGTRQALAARVVVLLSAQPANTR